jgi:hypothetical protein
MKATVRLMAGSDGIRSARKQMTPLGPLGKSSGEEFYNQRSQSESLEQASPLVPKRCTSLVLNGHNRGRYGHLAW